MEKLRRVILSLALVSGLLLPVYMPAVVAAQYIERGLCAGANLNVTDTTCDPSADSEAIQRIDRIIDAIINVFSFVVGVVSVIMIIVGGLKYITSGGDSGNVTSAKNTILYALIGLVIVAMAQVIVRFVLARATEG